MKEAVNVNTKTHVLKDNDVDLVGRLTISMHAFEATVPLASYRRS